MITAVPSDQNPPMLIPKRARAIIKTRKLGAIAIMTRETSIRPVMARRTHLRSRRPAAVVTTRLAATAKKPLIEIAWPVWPSVAPRLSAIGVSRLTGMNSAEISRATQRDMERTAPQAPLSSAWSIFEV